MNSTRPRVSDLTFHVFGRPLHPELFETAATRKVPWRDAVVEVGVLRTGHWIRFTRGGLTVCEVACDRSQILPECGRLFRARLRQERRLALMPAGAIRYEASFSLESLGAEAFDRVHDEIVASGAVRGMIHAFPDEARETSPLSHLVVEGRDGLVVASSFHTFPTERAIVRTGSMFEWRRRPGGSTPR